MRIALSDGKTAAPPTSTLSCSTYRRHHSSITRIFSRELGFASASFPRPGSSTHQSDLTLERKTLLSLTSWKPREERLAQRRGWVGAMFSTREADENKA